MMMVTAAAERWAALICELTASVRASPSSWSATAHRALGRRAGRGTRPHAAGPLGAAIANVLDRLLNRLQHRAKTMLHETMEADLRPGTAWH